jgi:hypothetical protein
MTNLVSRLLFLVWMRGSRRMDRNAQEDAMAAPFATTPPRPGPHEIAAAVS